MELTVKIFTGGYGHEWSVWRQPGRSTVTLRTGRDTVSGVIWYRRARPEDIAQARVNRELRAIDESLQKIMDSRPL